MRFKFIGAATATWLIVVSVYAQDSIPLNKNVRHGILKNGLSYYLFATQNPEKTIKFRLVQKVGKPHGSDGETNIAHFIEHMAFRGTKNFPSGLRKSGRWQSIGGRTSDQSTDYHVDIVSGDSSLLHNALLAMHDFSKGRLYLPEDVEGERAAVYNEFMRGDTSLNLERYLLLDKHPAFNNKTKQSEIRDIQAMTAEKLRRFDRRWYRPERQCLIITGDISVSSIEKKIISLFSDLKPETNESARQLEFEYREALDAYEVPLTGYNKLVVVPSSEKHVKIRLMQKRKAALPKGIVTVQQRKTKLMDDLYREMAMDRIKSPRAGESGGLISIEHLIDRRMMSSEIGIDALTTWITLRSLNEIKPILISLARELHRIEVYGFTEEEFSNAKKIVSNRQGKLVGLDNAIPDALQSYYLDGTVLPDNGSELNLQILSTISLSEINAMAEAWIREDGNTDILLTVPEIVSGKVPDERTVFNWIRTGRKSTVKPLKTSLPYIRSLPEVITGSALKVSQTELPDWGATKLVLGNGINLVIKRLGSDSENPWPDLGDITLSGFLKGGINMSNEEDVASAIVASDLIRNSGLSSLSKQQLYEFLRYKRKSGELSVYPQINQTETCIEGSADNNNATELFQLVYMYITKPGKDRIAFNQAVTSLQERASNKKSRLEIFNDSLEHVLLGTQGVQLRRGRPRLNAAYSFYRERFSNTQNFTFVITGFFETEDIIQEAVRYLGALPSRSKSRNANIEQPSATSVRSDIPKELRVKLVGDSVKNVDVRMMFTCQTTGSIRDQLLININAKILREVLFVRLREQEKAVYSANIGGRFREISDEYVLNIIFDTAPENIDRLTAAVIDEFNKIAEGNLNSRFFDQAVKKVSAEISRDSVSAYYVNQYISDQLRKGKMSPDGLKRNEILNTINKEDVIRFFRDSMDRGHYMLFELL